jgi:transcriptional regulator with XRE-family HTH domain
VESSNGTDQWRLELREARRNVRLTQEALANIAGVGPDTVRSYESGRREPTRERLTALLDALKLDRKDRNRILAGAGFATDGAEVGPWSYWNFMFTPAEAASYADELPWPAFVCSEMMEVVHANAAAQALWGVDLRTEFLDPVERNLLSVASNPRFASRCTNLPEAMEIMAAAFKGHHRGPEDLASPSPYFNTVITRFLAGERQYVEPFLRAFETAEPRTPKIRWVYPVVWHEPGIGTARFRCEVNPACEPDGLSFNDWIPVDAESWAVIEGVKHRAPK